ncbi:hypothetical protein CVT24_003722 [Panaeolus cyanescens]|uniref:Uncharacterized protein n=1 Tax=Panaeolus cyanescens TaxID=181874 RepID=A0A409YXP0_9AGAR|nr:hypothetical protein CVT24_003722 [Panaeolus cyanescens]
MFEDLGELQALTINSRSHDPDDWFSFSEMNILRHIQVAFPSLTSMAFLFWHQTRTTALNSFTSLISSINKASRLERLDFTISTSIEQDGDPLYDDVLFPSLTAIVSSLLQCQTLVDVDIHLKICLGQDASWDSEILSDDNLIPQLRAKIQGIEQETGAVLQMSFSPRVCEP